MVIYKVENLINGKLYIGKTSLSLDIRKSQHLKDASKNISKTTFHKAIRKYGKENFKFSIIRFCFSNEELNEKERYYIKKYNTMVPNGYNLTPGGDGVPKGTPSPNKGKHASEEQKEKQRIAMTGKKQSKETCEKISLAQTGENNYQWSGDNIIVKCRNKLCSNSFEKRPCSTKEYCNKDCMYSDPERSRISSEKNKGKKHKMPDGYTVWNKNKTDVKTNSKGKPAWNKGLTKETDERVMNISEGIKNSTSPKIFKKGDKPWNAGLNIVHSEESNLKRSKTMKNKKKPKETVENMKIAQQERRAKEKNFNNDIRRI
jgi:group I intron endonuclease